ncbi:MAG: glutathione S-transferase N-terminal domain-containing protein [bacterium]|nr:glutathione S-transferase N-terminal domain-containing protein [bacterium]
MKIIRWFLSKIFLTIEKLFSPKGVQRSPEAQAKVNREVSKLSLYQFAGCPFCVKVRFAMKRLSLPIQTRDAKVSPYREELLREGGQSMVPCLRIEKEGGSVQWMYESSDIIRHLEERFPT